MELLITSPACVHAESDRGWFAEALCPTKLNPESIVDGRGARSSSNESSESLIAEMRKGDPALTTILRNKVLLQNLPLLMRAVMECSPDEHRRDDCMSEGCFTLLRVVDNYSPTHGTSFAQYSAYILRRRLRG